jgi:hypothetical protein
MIKHFLKWLKLVQLLNCSSEGVVYAFLDTIFIRFDALIKNFTDQSTNFHEEFQVWENVDQLHKFMKQF